MRATKTYRRTWREFFSQLGDSMLSSFGSFGTLLVPRDSLQFDPMSGRITMPGRHADKLPQEGSI